MQINFYKVGGCVRDQLIGLKSKDIDYSVEAGSYDQMKEFLLSKGAEIYKEHPEYLTIKARFNGENADFVLCRKDGYYHDGRRPSEVEMGTLMDDLNRRDFTMNAIAIDSNGRLIDPHNGAADIEDKIIRCVGSTDRLKEDSLRMIRALRFTITKGFDMEEDIERVIHSDYALIKNVHKDRIHLEMNKMFEFSVPKTFEIMTQFRELFKFIFEECEVNLLATLKKL